MSEFNVGDKVNWVGREWTVGVERPDDDGNIRIDGSNGPFWVDPQELTLVARKLTCEDVGCPCASESPVDHPPHYGGDNTYEAIKVIEAWGLGFCLGNTVKYVCRAGKKGDVVEDLEKARWYLDREIARLKGGGGV